jgi:hypothetical protein
MLHDLHRCEREGAVAAAVSILSALLGIAVTVGIWAAGRVDTVRREKDQEIAAWKTAFEGMKVAHSEVVDLQRNSQQATAITNTVMLALKSQLPPSPAGGS